MSSEDEATDDVVPNRQASEAEPAIVPVIVVPDDSAPSELEAIRMELTAMRGDISFIMERISALPDPNEIADDGDDDNGDDGLGSGDDDGSTTDDGAETEAGEKTEKPRPSHWLIRPLW